MQKGNLQSVMGKGRETLDVSRGKKSQAGQWENQQHHMDASCGKLLVSNMY